MTTVDDVLLALKAEREAEAHRAAVRAARQKMYAEREAALAAQAAIQQERVVAADPELRVATMLRERFEADFPELATEFAKVDARRLKSKVADLASQAQAAVRNASLLQAHLDREPERKRERAQSDAQAVLEHLGLMG